ncbi:MAG: hypothetical protein R2804_18685 [Cyclobacteriaceae bacterium]
MKRLNRLEGYTDAQVRHFNEMYDRICTYEIDVEEENNPVFPDYTKEELGTLNAYVILADLDEKKRLGIMNNKWELEDYTPEEIEHFDHMQEVLTAYNKLLDEEDIDIALIIPDYSDIEMLEHSQYREIWIGHQCRDL